MKALVRSPVKVSAVTSPTRSGFADASACAAKCGSVSRCEAWLFSSGGDGRCELYNRGPVATAPSPAFVYGTVGTVRGRTSSHSSSSSVVVAISGSSTRVAVVSSSSSSSSSSFFFFFFFFFGSPCCRNGER
ncbi:uncharacterized protein BO97DRAFT_240570 [Aspergillus homomorphus CBS 101889]|uniref:Apple domain-containing protein n=1 Tax=Aspergillus homomorphus (strain CBS 101889) TaxID=1450537 RepID=A0A395I7G6_ASPHC|nr:hypothetical protein BO97DRAFT_240570 [Aspergillus homomorphus CBS 101889]RAL15213.1 hypothetical protein BO97DRAFT_240570 [Aspergillus homomorphus CBS 101889]